MLIGSILAFIFGASIYDDWYMSDNTLAFLVFFAGIALGVYGVVAIYNWNNIRKNYLNLINLVIATNSGKSFAILFSSRGFLMRVLDALKKIIANPSHTGNIIFNIKDNTITGSVIDTVNEIK